MKKLILSFIIISAFSPAQNNASPLSRLNDNLKDKDLKSKPKLQIKNGYLFINKTDVINEKIKITDIEQFLTKPNAKYVVLPCKKEKKCAISSNDDYTSNMVTIYYESPTDQYTNDDFKSDLKELLDDNGMQSEIMDMIVASSKTKDVEKNAYDLTPDEMLNRDFNQSSSSQNTSNKNPQISNNPKVENYLEFLNKVLKKYSKIGTPTIKIKDGIITNFDGFLTGEASISDFDEIIVDDKYNEVKLMCKKGPYCVKKEKYLMQDGITYYSAASFDRGEFAKLLKKVLIDYGGNSVSQNTLKIKKNMYDKKYEQILEQINASMDEVYKASIFNLRVKRNSLFYEDGIIIYEIKMSDIGSIVSNERRKTVIISCKNKSDCVLKMSLPENHITFERFGNLGQKEFTKMLQNAVNAYDGL